MTALSGWAECHPNLCAYHTHVAYVFKKEGNIIAKRQCDSAFNTIILNHTESIDIENGPPDSPVDQSAGGPQGYSGAVWPILINGHPARGAGFDNQGNPSHIEFQDGRRPIPWTPEKWFLHSDMNLDGYEHLRIGTSGAHYHTDKNFVTKEIDANWKRNRPKEPGTYWFYGSVNNKGIPNYWLVHVIKVAQGIVTVIAHTPIEYYEPLDGYFLETQIPTAPEEEWTQQHNARIKETVPENQS